MFSAWWVERVKHLQSLTFEIPKPYWHSYYPNTIYWSIHNPKTFQINHQQFLAKKPKDLEGSSLRTSEGWDCGCSRRSNTARWSLPTLLSFAIQLLAQKSETCSGLAIKPIFRTPSFPSSLANFFEGLEALGLRASKILEACDAWKKTSELFLVKFLDQSYKVSVFSKGLWWASTPLRLKSSSLPKFFFSARPYLACEGSGLQLRSWTFATIKRRKWETQ